METTTRVEKKVAELAKELDVEYEITEHGYVPRKGERILCMIPRPAFGVISPKNWEDPNFEHDGFHNLKSKAKWVKILTPKAPEEQFDKLVYKVATVRGCSKLYLVKYSNSKD